MEKKYISIDIGGTAIKYGILTEEGAILERYEMATEAYKGGPEILKKAEGIVEGFLNSGKVLKEELLGICISTAGMVDTEKGEIFYSAPLIPNYIGTKFKMVMETRFHVPCEVENDVNCAGLAEYMSGASKGSKSALMLTIGTGIGGSMVIGGEVMAQEEYLRGRIETALRKYLVPSIAKHTKLAFAKHRNDAGMLGAYYHFQNMQRK